MTDNKSENSSGSDAFECSICLEQATEPVVTLCGHLFCWPCLAKWMDGPMSAHNTCPVCKSLISRDSIVPLYGRGAPPHKHPHPAAAAAAAAATSAADDGNKAATESSPPPVSGSYSLNDSELRQRHQGQTQTQTSDNSGSSTEAEHIPPRPQGHRQPPPTNQYGQYVPQAVPGAFGMNNGGFFGNILPGYGSVNFGFGFGLPFLGFGGMWAPFRQPPVVQPGLDPNVRPQARGQNAQNQTVSGIIVGVLLFIFLLLMLFSSSQTRGFYTV